jgi:hypothetical protein
MTAMIFRLWRWYMADVHAWEQHARTTNDDEMLALVELFKSNRITALCMGVVMLVSTLLLTLWRMS